MLFATEADAHAGVLQARRVPGYPPRHPARRGVNAEPRGVGLPGPRQSEAPAAGNADEAESADSQP